MTATVASPIPLTTTFSPPADCTTDTWYIEYLSGTYWTTDPQTASDTGWFISLGPTDWSTCYPSGYTAATDFYYSPAPGICPSGYELVSSDIVSAGTVTETHGSCCPSGYSAIDSTTLVWNSLQPCTSRHGHTTWSFTKDGTVSSFYTTSAAGINAKAVSIRWQSTDLYPATTSATTTASTGTTATSTGSSASQTSTTEASAAQTSTTSAGGGGSSGLSSGAKAGIGIGAAAGCILLILLGILGLRWQKRRKVDAELAQNRQYGELEGHSAAHELGQSGISGMGPHDTRAMHLAELDKTERPPAELEAYEK